MWYKIRLWTATGIITVLFFGHILYPVATAITLMIGGLMIAGWIVSIVALYY